MRRWAAETQVVDGSPADDETEVWREAYALEAERAGLIAEQLESELARMGDLSDKLRDEYEGCILDLEPLPDKPESEASDEWAAAYTAIRRCNEQAELRVTEMRSKISERSAAAAQVKTPEVTMDFGPIEHLGTTFKDITFKRFGGASGSKIFFLELPMPLGTSLQDVDIELRDGRVARAIQINDVLESGSAFKDGRVQVGDYVRAITVPKRRFQQGDDEDEVGTFADNAGIGAGTLEKALLVIPLESSFPFEQILQDIGENQQVDSLVGLVVERPFD